MRSENYHQRVSSLRQIWRRTRTGGPCGRDIKNIIGAPHQHLAVSKRGLLEKRAAVDPKNQLGFAGHLPVTRKFAATLATQPTSAPTGFVFQNCTVDGNKEFMVLFQAKSQLYQLYLGRPWEEYAKTIYVSCYLGKVVRPEGWLPWRGDFALRMLYYGECDSRGAWCKSHSED